MMTTTMKMKMKMKMLVIENLGFGVHETGGNCIYGTLSCT